MKTIMKFGAGAAAGAALLAMAGPAAADFTILQNFDTPPVSGIPGASSGYVLLDGDLDGWTYDNAGLISGTNPYGPAPASGQYAFILDGGSISYTFTAPNAVRFSHFSFFLGGRGGPGPTIDLIVQGPDLYFSRPLYANGLDGEKAHPGGFTEGLTYTVTFQALNGTAYLDNVFILGGGAPEPGTWALMLLGFGAAGTALRRARATVAI